MRIAPVSGDLLVKLALVVVGVGVAVYAVRRVSAAVSGIGSGITDGVGAAWGAVQDGAWAVTPWNNDNVIYQTVNEVFWPARDQSLGTWIYDLVHPEPTPEYEFMGPPNPYTNVGGSASVTPGYNGPGGAAFGIYPRANTGGASGSW